MKRVLIITYYWPPSGGSGVQRWLYFTKYLRDANWEPIIYTVQNGEYPYTDSSLQQHIPDHLEVIKGPIWEPYALFKKLSGKKEQVNPSIFSEMERGSWFKRFLLWIRGNFFIPDARMFWIRPSVHLLENYLKKHPVDFIVSTGPPHSTHLIARSLKRRLDIPWLADFRDPWTQIYSFKQLNLSKLSKRIHHRLEHSVLQEASLVVTVSPDCKKGLESLVNREVSVITNGYETFPKQNSVKDHSKIKMVYAGVLSADRNPGIFWKVLENYLSDNPAISEKFELILIGNIDPLIVSQLKVSGLSPFLQVLASMPHAQLQHYLFEADLLLLVGVPGNKGVITGKFFEYLYLQKPIYSISPDNSDVVTILKETEAGLNADYTDAEQLYSNLERLFEMVATNSFPKNETKIANYSRKNLTTAISNLMSDYLEKYK